MLRRSSGSRRSTPRTAIPRRRRSLDRRRTAPGDRQSTSVRRRQRVRVALQLVVSAALLALIVSAIDVGRAADIVADASLTPLAGALLILLLTTAALAVRWQVLLVAKGLGEPLRWLTKICFVAQAVGQVLPTAVGGDAVRIIEHARRRHAAKADVAAAVVMDRLVGAAMTLVLAAFGLAAVAAEHEDLRVYLWFEICLAAVVVGAGVVLFSGRARPVVRAGSRLAGAIRLQGPVRSLYVALHSYGDQRGALAIGAGLSLVVHLARAGAMWLCAVASGIRVGAFVIVLLSALIALVMMVPVTANGIGVREGFFVVFLTRFGADADAAFAAGFLFFLLSVVATLPGVALIAASRMRRSSDGANGAAASDEGGPGYARDARSAGS